MFIELSQSELLIIVSALNSYQESLSERELRQDYWFRAHSTEQYKQKAEDSKVFLQARMLTTDTLRTKLLSFLSPEGID